MLFKVPSASLIAAVRFTFDDIFASTGPMVGEMRSGQLRRIPIRAIEADHFEFLVEGQAISEVAWRAVA